MSAADPDAAARPQIHFITGRAEERLSFDLQAEIGRRMHYTDHAGTRGVERFVKHYYLHAKTVGELTRIFCAALDDAHKRKPRFGMFRLATLRPKQIEGFRKSWPEPTNQEPRLPSLSFDIGGWPGSIRSSSGAFASLRSGPP